MSIAEAIRPTAPESLTPPRLPSLTGVRFIAAAMVFVFHASIQPVIGGFTWTDAELAHDYLFLVSNLGWVGVSFFFVLSGFVLTWSLRAGDSMVQFWRGRFFKIVPNHVVIFTVALVLAVVAGGVIKVPEALASLFLVSAWVPEPSYLIDNINVPNWTLSVEALFYLAFPFLIILIRKIRPSRLWYWAGATMVAIPLMPLVAMTLLPDTPLYPPEWPTATISWAPVSWTQLWFVYLFPVVRALEFVLGMLLARIVLTGRWPRLGLAPVTGLAVAGYLISIYAPFHFLYDFVASTAIALGLLVAAAAAADISGRRTFMGTRPMVWLGDISFAFYLVHWIVIINGPQVVGLMPGVFGEFSGLVWSTPAAIAFIVVFFAISILGAWALYSLVERPIMRRWARPRPKVGSSRNRE